MKRLDIIVRLDKVNDVVKAINEVGVGGMTVMHARGQGAADPPLVGQFYSREIIVLMIDDSKIDKLKSAIANVACTNLKGDGKIFVSDVEDAFDICSGGSGKDAL